MSKLNARRRLLEDLRALTWAPLMRGSIVERRRRCGRPGCRCAQDRRRWHPGKYLSVHLGGKTVALHLRPDDEAEVRAAIEAYEKLWAVVDALTAVEVRRLRRAAQERRRLRTRRKKKKG